MQRGAHACKSLGFSNRLTSANLRVFLALPIAVLFLCRGKRRTICVNSLYHPCANHNNMHESWSSLAATDR